MQYTSNRLYIFTSNTPIKEIPFVLALNECILDIHIECTCILFALLTSTCIMHACILEEELCTRKGYTEITFFLQNLCSVEFPYK